MSEKKILKSREESQNASDLQEMDFDGGKQ